MVIRTPVETFLGEVEDITRRASGSPIDKGQKGEERSEDEGVELRERGRDNRKAKTFLHWRSIGQHEMIHVRVGDGLLFAPSALCGGSGRVCARDQRISSSLSPTRTRQLAADLQEDTRKRSVSAFALYTATARRDGVDMCPGFGLCLLWVVLYCFPCRYKIPFGDEFFFCLFPPNF